MTKNFFNHPPRALRETQASAPRGARVGGPRAKVAPANDQSHKIMRIALASALLVAFALTSAIITAAQAQESRAGRYTMHKTEDGFVRLDTETGAVSLCQKSDSGWGCKSIAGGSQSPSSSLPQQSEAGEEIDRLARENADLKAEIRRLDELLGLRGNRDRNATAPKDFKLPTEQEVDQALNYVERMLRKFKDRLKRFEDGLGTSGGLRPDGTRPDDVKPDAAKPDNALPERRL